MQQKHPIVVFQRIARVDWNHPIIISKAAFAVWSNFCSDICCGVIPLYLDHVTSVGFRSHHIWRKANSVPVAWQNFVLLLLISGYKNSVLMLVRNV